MKHPAFPKSVCGVVYEGSRRATGCQFTFTCDGSLSRRPLAVKWLQAQSVAADSLAGRTADVVGASTHYHASWMTPYWQSSMVETARIGGHIFYQKPGLQPRWTPSAVAYDGAERAGPSATLPPAPTEFANPRRRARQTDFARRRSGPATFSVWGLRVATLTPVGKTIVVQDDQ